MKHYEVRISDKASEDMDDIYTYIAETLVAPVAAANQYDRITDAILTLEEMPDRIRIMDSEPGRSKGLRRLPVDNYSVFYVVKSEIVLVTRVLYSASDVDKRLSEE
jgi:plasmid stabilization system protein ParE